MLCAPAASSAADFSVQRASVAPERGFTHADGGVRIEFRIAAAEPAQVTIRVLGGGREVRRFTHAAVEPGADRVQVWDGLNEAGRLVPDGSYRVLVGDGAGGDREAGWVALSGHFFPVRGPHGTRGGLGEFGAGRSGGRTHEGFDVTGRCGTPLAAVRAGTVVRRGFDPRLKGNFVVIRGLAERRTFLYAHMARPSRFRRGDEVHPGDVVGQIGRTGNAASTPCHLHFELRTRGRLVNPEPHLHRWDRFS